MYASPKTPIPLLSSHAQRALEFAAQTTTGEINTESLLAGIFSVSECDVVQELSKLGLTSDALFPAEDLKLSPSVHSAKTKLGKRLVSSFDLVRVLFELHPEYVSKKAKALDLSRHSTAATRSAAEWLTSVRKLFLDDLQLHGKLVIIGLCLLDSQLKELLSSSRVSQGIISSLKEPVPALLTEYGRERWRSVFVSSDEVPMHGDSPAMADQLGRIPFARALAIRLRRIREEEGAHRPFRLHIHGPWGSGKTSLMNFLRDELQNKKGEEWIVVDFNAWQHQRVGQPWWWLMDSVYRQSLGQLWKFARWNSLKLYWRENNWRLEKAWGFYFVALLLFAFLGIVLWVLQVFNFTRTISEWGQGAQAISAVLAMGATLWAGIVAFTRPLILGSSSSAHTFLQSARDPLQTTKKHFQELIDWIKPRPVAIFIDDLDRCRSDYVIQFLEAIQTLFADAPVTFVIAADRRWIGASFQKHYESFSTAVDEPGRPLGYLFLEKTFQLSVSVPGLSEVEQKRYWERLIRISPESMPEEVQNAREAAQIKLQGLKTEDEILITIDREADPVQKQALREQAVVRLADPNVEKKIEHTLLPFAHLLEPNPRSMKRLVNSYGIQRSIAVLSGVWIPRGKLVLWTILALRWPLLAEYLLTQPELVEHFKNNSVPKEIADNDPVRKLFAHQSVKDVILGAGVDDELDPEAIRACLNLRTSDSSSSAVA